MTLDPIVVALKKIDQMGDFISSAVVNPLFIYADNLIKIYNDHFDALLPALRDVEINPGENSSSDLINRRQMG